MENNLKNYLQGLFEERGPLTTDDILDLVDAAIKTELKESFKSTCKKDRRGNQKRVWTLKKESSSAIPEEEEKDPFQQLLESQKKSEELNVDAVFENFGDIPEGCEPFSLTCRRARETQKEFCKQCSCYQTCEACNRLK